MRCKLPNTWWRINWCNMASGTPVIRQINWLAIALHLCIFVALVYFFQFLQVGAPSLMAIATYLVLAYFLRFFLAKYHRYGMMFLKQNAFENAIPYFENSYEFFQRHAWLDKFRAVFLLSSSRISYKEMALVNIAYCYSQLGDGTQAKVYYQRALKEFPDSGIAQAGLNMLRSSENGNN
ncbi:tetratricopeptide repeat protein [Adhaeribacter sp. BT258]|uniref:Tetratricopeptide repeat protein n=1 Tax=Adhaeribacter terrigena TaxID=2793070 RepID=A0ABS1BWN2_9BACT|nr:tetratricopeptide repeat protein [Adhaeribacter terrigena]MBK0401539.1 tetratricopeptide repeat protein [Adhaeribacter terrigena]